MPVYAYQCSACPTLIELRHSIKEDPPVFCPSCESPMGRVLIGGMAPLVMGATRLSHQEKAVKTKDREDMHHAQTVSQYVKQVAQPRARKALDAAIPKLAARKANDE